MRLIELDAFFKTFNCPIFIALYYQIFLFQEKSLYYQKLYLGVNDCMLYLLQLHSNLIKHIAVNFA